MSASSSVLAGFSARFLFVGDTGLWGGEKAWLDVRAEGIGPVEGVADVQELELALKLALFRDERLAIRLDLRGEYGS